MPDIKIYYSGGEKTFPKDCILTVDHCCLTNFSVGVELHQLDVLFSVHTSLKVSAHLTII